MTSTVFARWRCRTSPDCAGMLLAAWSLSWVGSRRLHWDDLDVSSPQTPLRDASPGVSLGSVGRYFLHDGPLFHEMRTKESLLHTEESQWATVLARLGGLDASDTIKASFERFVNGELTIKELSAAIDEYLSLKGEGVRATKDEEA